MTEADILKYKKLNRAKLYMELMRQGIDPMSKQPVAEDSVIRQEKIINCFSFISDILDELISDMEEKSVPAYKKADFSMSFEQARNVKITSSPVAVTTLVKRINDAIDKGSVRGIKSKDINDWLVMNGFISERVVRIVREEKSYTPGNFAESVGIFGVAKEKGTGEQPTMSIKFSESGQRFILDNIQQIAEYAIRNKNAEN